ncbi:hypothetical protein LPJ61_001799 [Coemansia biformis]|uniref:Phosphoglycerate mutase-like protein n=1 Tax=Coemansia biformis TaxID=1286918 RepID=A0A9W8D095_9FUNG|nr:hypothetical protein LPJ61_001799 [Coemansia biformis]
MTEARGDTAPLALFLVRHGETEVNRRNCVQGMRVDPPLNERGRRQAACLAQRFAAVAVDWVVTSGARRAIETGAAIHGIHPGAPLSRFAALNELEFGDLEGTHVAAGYNELVEQWDGLHRGDLCAPGPLGESPADCARRALACLHHVVETAVAEGRRCVCVVVHSRVIQIVLAAMLDGTLDTMGAYKQKKAAVNVVDVWPGTGAAAGAQWPFRCTAREINSTAHMPSDVVSRVSSASSLAHQRGRDELIRFETDSSGALVLRQLSDSAGGASHAPAAHAR